MRHARSGFQHLVISQVGFSHMPVVEALYTFLKINLRPGQLNATVVCMVYCGAGCALLASRLRCRDTLSVGLF